MNPIRVLLFLAPLLATSAGPSLALEAGNEAQLAPRSAGVAEGVRAQALRWGPGVDLRKALQAWVRRQGGAWAVSTAVGSLARASVRCAGREAYLDWSGPLEVVSLTGTLSPDGCHLHVALADASGQTRGGHMGDGAIVLTTAEVVLTELVGLEFRRQHDPCTGYKELVVEPRATGRQQQAAPVR